MLKGFIITVLLTLLVIAGIWFVLSGNTADADKPQFDFIYVKGNQEATEFKYATEDGKVVRKATNRRTGQDTTPRLYFYDVENNKSTPPTYEQASKLTVDPTPVSPDQYQFTKDLNKTLIQSLLSGSDEFYLSSARTRHALQIEADNVEGADVEFLAWVAPE